MTLSTTGRSFETHMVGSLPITVGLEPIRRRSETADGNAPNMDKCELQSKCILYQAEILFSQSREDLIRVQPELSRLINNIYIFSEVSPTVLLDGRCWPADRWDGGLVIEIELYVVPSVYVFAATDIDSSNRV